MYNYLLRVWLPGSAFESSFPYRSLSQAERAFLHSVELLPGSYTVQLRDQQSGTLLRQRPGATRVTPTPRHKKIVPIDIARILAGRCDD